ncbi:alpha-2C adrenergic receptor-like [Chelonus insularis]|uniref:alpha-2C adrenergic receptor-like n=1 Tax=Chelonus insularis TaxID=460826 RepID=UPI00158F3530|nr:alpha-2C adrenergic receptor-like [Chelonus insularis]
MPSYEGAVMNVISASSLASTSIFEENMSTSVDWSQSSSSISGNTIITSSYESTPSPSSITTHLDDKAHQKTCGACSIALNSHNEQALINKHNVTDWVVAKESQGDGEEEEDEGYASGDETVEERTFESDIGSELVEDSSLLFSFDEDLGTMEDLNVSQFNESLYNATCSNETYIVLGDSLYPSGYSLLQIILASIAATILMIVVVVGNMLVIIAIVTEKALKNIQNWFIASLAVADFFLGLVIMPFSLANEIMGYWIFGYWWCDIYSAMDVLLCTASIMNLCLISLDRYWSITQAVEYLKKRTPARAVLMIALVWVMAALVCIPPLLGWKRPTPEEEYPKCRVSHFMVYTLI